MKYHRLQLKGEVIIFLFNNHEHIPLYAQLYQQLRTQILNGELGPHNKLPSSRKLSDGLRISRNTVELAYQQLYSEGYITSRPRSGYYVEALDLATLPKQQQTRQESKIVEEQTGTALYDFRYGGLVPDELPFSQWQRLLNKCLRDCKNQLASYGQASGEPGLRTEILKYLHDVRGVNCKADQIVIGSGTNHCLGLICHLIRTKTPSVAVEDPGDFLARAVFQEHGFEVHPIGLDDCGLNVEELKATGARAVCVTPSHQFPMGIVMPIARRLELIDWANRHDSIIIEDDYSCHLRYDVKPIQSLQSLSCNHVIYVGTISKFLFPSMRLAYMVLPEDLANEFSINNKVPTVPFLVQKTLELFMQEGYWESYLRKTTRQQKRKHDTLIESLKDNFGESISISGVNAGIHLLIHVKWPMKEDELIKRAHQNGVKVYPTTKFWSRPQDDEYGTVLLGYGGIHLDDIPLAVNLLRQAWLEK